VNGSETPEEMAALEETNLSVIPDREGGDERTKGKDCVGESENGSLYRARARAEEASLRLLTRMLGLYS
jgi:hypothetical protein